MKREFHVPTAAERGPLLEGWIAELRQVKRRLLVHTGPRAFTTADGVEAVPVPDFVRLVERGLL